MTRKESIGRIIVSIAISGMTLVVSGATALATTSYHGSDYSQDYGSRLSLRACDVESDSNIVKGGFAYQASGGEQASITDGDGANGVCATHSGALAIAKHHTCEKNLFSWDCGNWQVT